MKFENRKEIEEKLEKIDSIWEKFIFEYKYCSKKIIFDNDIQTNYFVDIIIYIKDTLQVLYTKNINHNFTNKFSFTISFLQAIYTQQDLMAELLYIFNTGYNNTVSKNNLNLYSPSLDVRNDPDYYINRDIRNEIIGHPINKYKKELISSIIFGTELDKDTIEYRIYHRDNNFQLEVKKHLISDILNRHLNFLEKYLDIILNKMKSILDDYVIELDKLENDIAILDFNKLLELLDLYLENVYESEPCSKRDSLVEIHRNWNKHERYRHYINSFRNDLKKKISDTRNAVESIFDNKTKDASVQLLEEPSIKFINFGDAKQQNEIPREKTLNYYKGRLWKRKERNLDDFDDISNFFIKEYGENELVLEELNHLRENIQNEIEYYISVKYLLERLITQQ